MPSGFDVKKIVLEENGFSSFNEMQKKALDAGLLEKNLVVSSPTASGKTILLELCALNSILNKHQKTVYTCPLRALASEHFNDFRKKYSKKFGIRAALSIGDFDSSSSYLKDYDIVFCTNEKLDSLLRHRAQWLSSVGTLVIDEVHELDSGRGPTLEIVVTKMRFVSPKIRLLALSATIPNSKEIAKWLSAELVQSNFRPVKLVEGVFFNNRFEYGGGSEKIEKQKDPLSAIVLDTMKKNKQALVFANTRKRAEDYAKKLSLSTQKLLNEKEKASLQKASEKILHALEVPTEQCTKLSSLVKNGVSFHHAGLLQKQREVVEDAFREGAVKAICATPTLAAGINMPAFRVVIPSLYRYTEEGMQRIPVREYKQMAGRCLSGDTLVYVNNGAKKINELFSNFFEKTETGEKSIKSDLSLLGLDLETGKIKVFKVCRLWKRVTEQLVEIETRSGKILKVTPEHPLLSFTKINAGKPRISSFSNNQQLYKKAFELRENFGLGPYKVAQMLLVPEKARQIQHWFYDFSKPFENPYIWKSASELKVGENYKETDYLSCPVDFEVSGRTKLPIEFVSKEKFIIKGNTLMNKQGHQSHKFPEQWSVNLCRFIAKIMSDGSINYNKNDNSYLIRYFNKDKKVHDEYASIILELFGKNVQTKWRRGSYFSGFKSLAVGNFLANLGVPAGKKSFVLKLPRILFQLPKNMAKSFIKEYSDCDGWETPYAYFLITSSKELALDFCLLFSKLGFVGRLYKKKPNSFRKSHIWEMSISKSQFDNVSSNKVKFGSVCPDQIKKIRVIKEKQYVYDFTLENGHNFIANGLIVHNSGRPKFDSEGQSMVFAQSELEVDEIFMNYINGEMENVSSKLSFEPVLRTHLLGLIASNFVFDLKSMEDFFSKTFYFSQFGSSEAFFQKLSGILEELKEMGFIDSTEKSFKATPLGARVSELYLDPLSAHKMIQSLKQKSTGELSYLFVFSNTSEMFPFFPVSRKLEPIVWERLESEKKLLPVDVDKEMYFDTNMVKKFNTALIFREWVNETPEDKISKEFGVQPGIMHSKKQIAEWLAYSCLEISKLLGLSEHFSPLARLSKRIKHGVKEELIHLTELRGIGRVRARRLFRAGIRSVADVKRTDVSDLQKIIPPAVAIKVKSAFGK